MLHTALVPTSVEILNYYLASVMDWMRIIEKLDPDKTDVR